MLVSEELVLDLELRYLSRLSITLYRHSLQFPGVKEHKKIKVLSQLLGLKRLQLTDL